MHKTRFPRYNHPEKLLETRKGLLRVLATTEETLPHRRTLERTQNVGRQNQTSYRVKSC